MENLDYFANEINKDWDPEYNAKVEDNILKVFYNETFILACDDSYSIAIKRTGHDEALEQLKYMIER